jgi:hypothetical protein
LVTRADHGGSILGPDFQSLDQDMSVDLSAMF